MIDKIINFYPKSNILFLYNVCSAYNPVINLMDFINICITKEILNSNFIYIHIAKIDCRTYVN